ncbi:MAG TPA: DUF302 domain-containing protein [Candidatus Nanoarchaeia archaeon]|nr:DUF302 domain-containing protein [Candidatus Nanoarchaeia archaeon]
MKEISGRRGLIRETQGALMMKAENFMYIVETKKNFDEAVVSVLKSVEQKGWAVFNIYDIKERLAAKGFNHEPLKIIEICSAKHANKLLGKNRLISICMPCKINIIEDKGKVKIAGMNPSMITEFFPEVKKEEIKEVEEEIIAIINAAKGGLK